MVEPTGDLLTADAPADNQVATTPPAHDWHTDVPEEYKEKVAQKGWDGHRAAYKSYFELESAYGQTVKVPAEDASDEEKSTFYDRCGRPEKPEGYELPEIPEGMQRDEEFENTMCNIAHKAGAPKEQFLQLVKGYYEWYAARLHRSREAGEKTLHEDWSADYDRNLAVSQRACKQFGGDDFVKLLKDTGLGNNPVIVKTFLEIGKVNLDDSYIKGDQPKGEEGYVPKFKNSPEQYATMEGEEGEKARAYFEKQGHVYS